MRGLLYLSIGVGNSAGFSLKLEKCLGLVPHSSTQIDTMLPGIEEKAKTLVSSHKGSSLSLSLFGEMAPPMAGKTEPILVGRSKPQLGSGTLQWLCETQ